MSIVIFSCIFGISGNEMFVLIGMFAVIICIFKNLPFDLIVETNGTFDKLKYKK